MREVDPETGTMPNATAWLIFEPELLDEIRDLRHHPGPLARIIRPVPKSPKSSVLGPIDTAPYYALEVQASALGTVGGPQTDALGRALDTEGNIIPGLYAAGNAGGAPTKGFYGGAGGTISLGLAFGYLSEASADPIEPMCVRRPPNFNTSKAEAIGRRAPQPDPLPTST